MTSPWVPRDSVSELEDLVRQVRRWRACPGDRAGGGLQGTPEAPATPTNVSETDDAYLVELNLPGVRRGDITIALTGSELSISGEVRERPGMLRRRTRQTGRFAYRVTLAQDVNADRIEANLIGGVLAVRAPKTASTRVRT